MKLNMQMKLINDYQTKVLSVLTFDVISDYYPLVFLRYQDRVLCYTTVVLTSTNDQSGVVTQKYKNLICGQTA